MNQQIKQDKIRLTLNGQSEIMFDRFYGQEKDTRPPEQKFYLVEGNVIVLPTENLYSFLFNENPPGCAKSEGKGGKDYIRIGQSHLFIDPVDFIPFKRNGKDIVFDGFEGNEDIYHITGFAPRTKQGSLSIKQNLKKRPALKTPWALTFTITLVKNEKITADKVINWFHNGGITIGLGTYRPRFGRFSVQAELI